MAELARHYEIHSNQITDWNTQLLERATQVFEGPPTEAGLDLKELHTKIGQLTLERDFLEGTLIKVGGVSARR